MKVLIDRNIQRNAITQKTVLEDQPVQWGPLRWTVPVAKSSPRLPRPDEERRLCDVEALADVCNYAKAGDIELFISNELRMETSRQHIADGGYFGVNLLAGVPINSVPCPIDRTIIFSGTGDSLGTTEAEQMELFRSIKHPRFLQIIAAVGPTRIDDAYHLWTAEEAGLDAFLTMDYKFRDAVTQHRRAMASVVEVLRPVELLKRLHI